MNDKAQSPRSIPSVSDLLALPALAGALDRWGHDLVVQAARRATEAARTEVLQGRPLPDDWAVAVEAALRAMVAPSLRPVINATGVIVHTNLGRAPLSAEALAAVARVGAGYSNLEYRLDEGSRGSRHDHARAELRELTGAEDALVVNNNAAAVLLVLSALAAGREVIVSRGQLVEIGGGFRVPDVMAQSGARLVEVGTTNRTYVEDYMDAMGEGTALVMAVHRSNFYLGGFTHEPETAQLVEAAHRARLPFYADVGSGALLDTARFGLAHEPTVQEYIRAGADVVSFSGDKLLGGPQAGIIVGRAEQLAPMKRHPLMRAVRVGKMTLAALQATLLHYRRGDELEAVPVWRMVSTPPAEIERRARRWRRALGAGSVRRAESAIGGGSLPGQTLPTAVLALAAAEPQALAERLRAADPPVVARIEGDAVVLDPRTVDPRQDRLLLAIVRRALDAEAPR